MKFGSFKSRKSREGERYVINCAHRPRFSPKDRNQKGGGCFKVTGELKRLDSGSF